MGTKIIIPVECWYLIFAGYPKVRESLSQYLSNGTNAILVLAWYIDRNAIENKNTVKFPYSTGIKEMWYPQMVEKKPKTVQHWYVIRNLTGLYQSCALLSSPRREQFVFNLLTSHYTCASPRRIYSSPVSLTMSMCSPNLNPLRNCHTIN